MSGFDDIIRVLEEEIKQNLPGWEAQRKMVSPGREKLDTVKIEQYNPRKSSVLIWLFPKEGEIYTRLILRAHIGKVHGGQVAFPGGKYEETDTDLWHTALRESFEEIGLQPKKVTRVGQLSTVYIPPSNYLVHPFVGYSLSEMPPVIDKTEVSRTIDINIQTLLDPAIKGEKVILRSTRTEALTPYYDMFGFTVWGATAMILSELEELLRRTYKRMG